MSLQEFLANLPVYDPENFSEGFHYQKLVRTKPVERREILYTTTVDVPSEQVIVNEPYVMRNKKLELHCEEILKRRKEEQQNRENLKSISIVVPDDPAEHPDDSAKRRRLNNSEDNAGA